MARDFITVNPQVAERLARKASVSLVQLKTEQVAMRARLLAPGTMKQKIHVIPAVGLNPIGIVVSDHPATTYVLHGTKPHVIRPRARKMLRFEVGGRTVFARVVHHPGTKANNFLLAALLSVKSV
jgi:hypothetical protein